MLKESDFTPLGTTMRNRVSVSGSTKQNIKKSDIYKKEEFTAFIQRWDLQDVSRSVHLDQDFMTEQEKIILKDLNKLPHRVTHCFHTSRSDHVKLMKNPSKKTANYGNLQICGSVWACPVCATKITEERRRELEEACEIWVKKNINNNNMLMVTFTLPHNAGQKLSEVRSAFMDARRAMKGQKKLKRTPDFIPYRSLIEDFGIFGTVTGLEVTYGQNGWHVHSHDLFFITKNLCPEEIQDLKYKLGAAWLRALKKIKYNIKDESAIMNHAVKVDQAKTPADYISKFGQIVYDEKKDSLSSSWGATHELTKSHVKKGKKGGLTPWDFLRLIKDSDSPKFKKFYSRLFREYTREFHGRRQLFFSKGFKKDLDLSEKTDQEIAEETDNEAVLLGRFLKSEWNVVTRNKLRAKVRIMGADKTFAEILTYLNNYEKGKRNDTTRSQKRSYKRVSQDTG
ncbi:MAG: hypothetical protein GY870_16940 [archaeon]|nr:hypothetical protein [archaeon]